MIIKIVTTLQCIKKNQPISACANIGRNIDIISKSTNYTDIENVAVSTAEYFADPINRYTSTIYVYAIAIYSEVSL